MHDILLAQIHPMDHHPNFQYFPDEKPSDFTVSVLNGESLQLTVSYVHYYARANSLIQKVDAITKNLCVDYGGHVVAIDKYPHSRFRSGAQSVEKSQRSSFSRYEIECQYEKFGYDAVILVVPDSDPIVLSTLKFGCYDPKGYSASFIEFHSHSVLSVTSLFGDVRGIAFTNCNNEALNPNSTQLSYGMSFERISQQAALLQNSFMHP